MQGKSGSRVYRAWASADGNSTFRYRAWLAEPDNLHATCAWYEDDTSHIFCLRNTV